MASHAKAQIRLSNGWVFEKPEDRIREYCKVEVYRGYDDKTNVTDNITLEDIQAADRLYANIMRFWKPAAKELMRSTSIPIALNTITNSELGDIRDSDWPATEKQFRHLFKEFFRVHGVSLGIATKILHLKRPRLFPILDSYVMKFILGINTSGYYKEQLLERGISALNRSRTDLIRNSQEFGILQQALSDLPIPLEKVRLYDILCWTAEKWDIRRETCSYGIRLKTLRQ